MQKDSIAYRKIMSVEETRAFMRKLEGKPKQIEFNGCKICGCEETGFSEKFNVKYCKGCLTEIN